MEKYKNSLNFYSIIRLIGLYFLEFFVINSDCEIKIFLCRISDEIFYYVPQTIT